MDGGGNDQFTVAEGEAIELPPATNPTSEFRGLKAGDVVVWPDIAGSGGSALVTSNAPVTFSRLAKNSEAVLKSPNGNRFRVTVSDSGVLETVPVK
jgi:hypothetical protein